MIDIFSICFILYEKKRPGEKKERKKLSVVEVLWNDLFLSERGLSKSINYMDQNNPLNTTFESGDDWMWSRVGR